MLVTYNILEADHSRERRQQSQNPEGRNKHNVFLKEKKGQWDQGIIRKSLGFFTQHCASAWEKKDGPPQRADSSHVINTHISGMRVQEFPAHGFLNNNIQPGPRLRTQQTPHSTLARESLRYIIVSKNGIIYILKINNKDFHQHLNKALEPRCGKAGFRTIYWSDYSTEENINLTYFVPYFSNHWDRQYQNKHSSHCTWKEQSIP